MTGIQSRMFNPFFYAPAETRAGGLSAQQSALEIVKNAISEVTGKSASAAVMGTDLGTFTDSGNRPDVLAAVASARGRDMPTEVAKELKTVGDVVNWYLRD